MSQSVERLRELLFEGESQAMADLAQRINAIAESDNRAREELKQKVSQIFDRVGTTERLSNSVAEVLDDALRQAEVNQHAELSSAIAPLVLSTIKTELKNSQDDMVEALYPITGRLVKSYVASAIKDLADQINRRVEKNWLMLRLQSLTTGRSVAELAMASTQDFQLQELYLIRRGSGDLIAHWPQTANGGRQQQAMSGVLAAINEFANNAFAADQSSLRQIDLGDTKVYLRGSPLFLLAAKCLGSAPKGIEQVLDDAFLAAVEMEHEISADNFRGRNVEKEQLDLLTELGVHLEARIGEQKAELKRRGRGPLKVLLALLILPVVGWFGWNWYIGYEEVRVRDAAERVIVGTSSVQGYPIRLDTSWFGRVLTISGLSPSQEAKEKVIERLSKVLTGTEIRDQLVVVPGGNTIISTADPDPHLAEQISGQVTGQVVGQVTGQVAEQIDKQNAEMRRTVTGLEAQMAFLNVRRAADRADRRLRQALNDLDRTAKATEEPERVIALKRITQGIEIVARDLANNRTALNAADFDTSKIAGSLSEIATRIEGLGGDIAKYMSGESLQGGPARRAAKVVTEAAPASLEGAAENLAVEAERLAAMAATVALTNGIGGKTVATAPPPPPEPNARARLDAYTRSHAVFFGNAAEYRNPAFAEQTLQEIAQLIKDAGVVVRVVGYSDEVGVQSRNNLIAMERSRIVRQDLITRGVPENLLMQIGRTKVADLGPTVGPGSPNRRVEFELAFEGEAQP